MAVFEMTQNMTEKLLVNFGRRASAKKLLLMAMTPVVTMQATDTPIHVRYKDGQWINADIVKIYPSGNVFVGSIDNPDGFNTLPHFITTITVDKEVK